MSNNGKSAAQSRQEVSTASEGTAKTQAPMGAVAVSDDIYDTVVNKAPEGALEFFHGYTYSGHPAACAAGLATLEIYEREKLFERAADLSDYFLDAMFDLRDLDVVTDIRGIGLLAGIDLAPGKAPGVRGTYLQKKLFWSGLHVKFTGDCGIVAPPLVSDRAVIDEIHKILKDVLSEESV